MTTRKNIAPSLFGALALAFVVGCAPGGSTPPATAAAPVPVPAANYTPKAEAGIPFQASTDAQAFPKLVASRAGNFVARKDPFALSGEEAAYEALQSSERLLSSTGGFSLEYTPPPTTIEEQPVEETQPYRRLAGIIVGDSVLALIDMGDGRGLQLIRPGQQIEGTEWRVAAIDDEKATLVRSGNRLPRRISVRLESPPAGFAPAGGAPGVRPGAGGGGPSASGMSGAGGGPGAAGGADN
jgi:hypothetical protein